MIGRVHSIQTLSGVDGPGMRCVVFLQGCPLRCLYCQNPDTHPTTAGEEMPVEKVMQSVLRCRPYFGANNSGGLTLSGGEPLLQAKFAAELFRLCRQENIHTALDTSGCILNNDVEELLNFTDLVLLDIKHTNPHRHLELTAWPLDAVLAFLDHLVQRQIATWIRQVIVPTWNDTPEDIAALAGIVNTRNSAGPTKIIQRVELLPYHRLARQKYADLGLAYPLADTPEMDEAKLAKLRTTLDRLIK
jgi:pyruvate formate lyase activating enzyme